MIVMIDLSGPVIGYILTHCKDVHFTSRLNLFFTFQVVAEREWTLSIFLKCTEDMFHSLYPHDPKLKVAGIQNEFHFDIPLNYKVEEVLVDAGLVFILEKEVSLFKALT